MNHLDGMDKPSLPMTSAPSRLPTLAAMAVAVAILFFAKAVFLPLAIAILLTFTLAPIVSKLRRLGLPRVLSVITSVAGGFVIIAVFSTIIAFQVTEVGQNISTYQYNIIEKIRTLKEAGAESGFLDRLNRFAERIGAEINRPEQKPGVVLDQQEPERKPILVEIFSPRDPIETLESIIEPLIGPLSTTGLVIVVVVFMLLEREELRDRFIRLVGYGDLHRTTEALQDAGNRVGRYLLTQLLVNIAYGVPLGLGLWVLGIPNALLWGILAIVLRFVPYIGPVIAAVMPLFLAIAVAPDWSLLFWTIALFVVIELFSNNVIEPWLYGARTGLSPLAVIVSAIFWAWLWGPVGLVLSTPLTVCLVVLGRHVPQFEFLEILFGSEPVLDPKERLYQRLLAGDPNEATDNALEILTERFLVEYYGKVAIPALLLAEYDRARGSLSEAQQEKIAHSARLLVANLAQVAADEEDSEEEVSVDSDGEAQTEGTDNLELPSGEGKSILCFGGRGVLDDITAIMLAQVLTVQGAGAQAVGSTDLQPSRLDREKLAEATALVLCFLDMGSALRARYAVRRLKRLQPLARVGVAIFDGGSADSAARESLEKIGMDFYAFSLADAVVESLSDAAPVAIEKARPTVSRRLPSMPRPKVG